VNSKKRLGIIFGYRILYWHFLSNLLSVRDKFVIAKIDPVKIDNAIQKLIIDKLVSLRDKIDS